MTQFSCVVCTLETSSEFSSQLTWIQNNLMVRLFWTFQVLLDWMDQILTARRVMSRCDAPEEDLTNFFLSISLWEKCFWGPALHVTFHSFGCWGCCSEAWRSSIGARGPKMFWCNDYCSSGAIDEDVLRVSVDPLALLSSKITHQ